MKPTTISAIPIVIMMGVTITPILELEVSSVVVSVEEEGVAVVSLEVVASCNHSSCSNISVCKSS